MPWTYKFTPDDVGSSKGTATVTFTDDDVFNIADELEAKSPFVYSHRIALDAKTDDALRLKAEILEALAEETARRTASDTQSTVLATLLALK